MKELYPKIEQLLEARGVTSEAERAEFLSDKPQKTYDPFLLLNMDAGVDLVFSAIDAGKPICIYGDYDADGITSTVLLTEVLRQMTDQLSFYIPSRFREGYGLNKGAIKRIADAGFGMIITVDCGSTSPEECAYAQELGLDILVTDHHTIGDRLAECAVINPAQPDCPYPFKSLAGVGVAFKFAQALTREAGLSSRLLNRTLDLVALGTIGDIVPLVDENRTLVKYGLRAINTRNRANLDQLIRTIGLTPGRITSEQVSFGIVPHLNSAGRMKSASYAADLFLTKDPARAEKRAGQLRRMNQSRRSVQESIYQECCAQIEEKYEEDPFLLLDLKNAHEGVTGIVAGKLKERYDKPVVIVTEKEGGICKGTGRSVPRLNLYELLRRHQDAFLTFGGHAAACGFTMRTEDVDALRKGLNEDVRSLLKKDPDLLSTKKEPELILERGDLTLPFVRQLGMLAPFGNQNEFPLARVEARCGQTGRMGSEQQYLRFTADVDGTILPCAVFKGVDEIERTVEEAAGPVEVDGFVKIHEWNGRESLEMNVQGVSDPKK